MAVSDLPTQTTRTASGLFARFDKDLGLLVHVPKTASMFAVARPFAQMAWKAINGERVADLPWQMAHAFGLDSRSKALKQPASNLLPSETNWEDSPTVARPILINWFITGECPLRCVYCYAEDMMRGRRGEPDAAQLQESANTIESLSPIVVVLSGGDPLFGPNIYRALPLLSGRVGLMIDTSGYTLTDRHIAVLREHNVVVRLSIDSVFPRVQALQRPLNLRLAGSEVRRKSSHEAAIVALDRLLNAGITVGVQTVATKQNLQDLPALGERLAQIGVKNWRVLKVALAEPNQEVYWRLVGSAPGQKPNSILDRRKSPFGYVFARLMAMSQSRWQGRMRVQVADNDRVNAVILVGPDGRFYTESTLRPEKVLIDRERPAKPRLARFSLTVDWHAHASRYLNTTSLRYLNYSEK